MPVYICGSGRTIALKKKRNIILKTARLTSRLKGMPTRTGTVNVECCKRMFMANKEIFELINSFFVTNNIFYDLRSDRKRFFQLNLFRNAHDKSDFYRFPFSEV